MGSNIANCPIFSISLEKSYISICFTFQLHFSLAFELPHMQGILNALTQSGSHYGFPYLLLNFAVVIEEIQEDDKGEVQKGSNKKQSSENGDKSQLQLVVRAPATESLESEDEDDFPVSFSESKKSSESASKKKGGKDKEASNDDRKRKSGAITDLGNSSGYMLSHVLPQNLPLINGLVTCPNAFLIYLWF